MNEKKAYEPPVMNIIYFEVEDILTTSGRGGIELPDHDWE